MAPSERSSAPGGSRSAAQEIGLQVRAGVHTGEVEMVPGNLRGLAVHVAARILALAGPAEVVVSWTTRDLLAGTAFSFEDRGMHELKGIAGPRAVLRGHRRTGAQRGRGRVSRADSAPPLENPLPEERHGSADRVHQSLDSQARQAR